MNTGLQLYEIERIVYDILNNDENINEETGELLPEATAKLNALEIGKERLIRDVALFQITTSGEAELIDREIKRLQTLKGKAERKANSAKKLLQKYVVEGEKLDLVNVQISWRKSDVVVTDPFEYNDEALCKTNPELLKVTYELKKKEVKDYFKAHGVLPKGISIKQNNNIQIQ